MSTGQALEHAAVASHLRLDGLMLAAPPTACRPAELADHVSTVVAAAGLPTFGTTTPNAPVCPSPSTPSTIWPQIPVVGIKEHQEI